jgi:hypothetical protein
MLSYKLFHQYLTCGCELSTSVIYLYPWEERGVSCKKMSSIVFSMQRFYHHGLLGTIHGHGEETRSHVMGMFLHNWVENHSLKHFGGNGFHFQISIHGLCLWNAFYFANALRFNG